MKTDYEYIIVESYRPTNTNGLHGDIHIKPISRKDLYNEDMHVECSKKLSTDYAVGTRFKIKVKITDREGGKPFAYSHYSWPFEILS